MKDWAFGLTVTILGIGYHTLLVDPANQFPNQVPNQALTSAYPRKGTYEDRLLNNLP
jgi:hypothetical protein